jgi:8-oxo-dGTP diphosphatase
VTTTVVTAAVIEKNGRFLVTRRQQGVHLEGYWEFPGGKCEPGEDLGVCLARELREELGVTAHIRDELLATTHEYADRRIEIHFIRCVITGQPAPLLGQDIRWVARPELAGLAFPPADADLIRLLSDKR